ncbi:MAG: sigma-70 family RNA polymerase sigma factor [Anaerohalosphaera sp.]|nr:sigma-70 family RNA polymerase sigma factor [Anaerohalosphaera sp.]
MNNRETESFLKLLMPNQKRIFSYIVTLIPNYADAEDVMQEVVNVLLRKYSDYTPNTDFVAWALTITRYKIYEYYKEKKRDQQRLSNETVRFLDKESSTKGPDFDSNLEAVKKCIGKLDAKDYKLIQLRYEMDQNVKSISLRFGRSVQSIYRNLSRVHNILLRCISRHLHQEGPL